MNPLIIGGLGATELLIILAVLVLLFGATKLPELARGSGRALRIFKDETKHLTDGSDDRPDDRPDTEADVVDSTRRPERGPVG
jgi:sec-independent protein translocase protein TatA